MATPFDAVIAKIKAADAAKLMDAKTAKTVIAKLMNGGDIGSLTAAEKKAVAEGQAKLKKYVADNPPTAGKAAEAKAAGEGKVGAKKAAEMLGDEKAGAEAASQAKDARSMGEKGILTPAEVQYAEDRAKLSKQLDRGLITKAEYDERLAMAKSDADSHQAMLDDEAKAAPKPSETKPTTSTKPAAEPKAAAATPKASTKPARARATLPESATPAQLVSRIDALERDGVLNRSMAKQYRAKVNKGTPEDAAGVRKALNDDQLRRAPAKAAPVTEKASLSTTMKEPVKPAADIPEPKVKATGESTKPAPTTKATGTTPKPAPKVAATGESPASLGAQTSGYDKTIGLPDPESPGGVRSENTGVFRESAGERIAHTPEGAAVQGAARPDAPGVPVKEGGKRWNRLIEKGFTPDEIVQMDHNRADDLIGGRTMSARQEVRARAAAAAEGPSVSSTGRSLSAAERAAADMEFKAGESPAPVHAYPDKVTPKSSPGQPTPTPEPTFKLTGRSLGEPMNEGASLADELTGRMEFERKLGPEAMGKKPLALGPAGSTGNGLNVLPVADEAAAPLIRQTSGGLGAQLGGGIDDVERLAQNAMAADAAAEAAKRGPLKRFLMGNLGKGAAAEAEAGLAAQAARAAAAEGGLTAAAAGPPIIPPGGGGGGGLKNLLLGGKSLMKATPYMAAGIGTEMAGRALAEQIDDNDTDSWLGGAAKAVLPMAAGGAVAGSAGGLPGAAIGALLASGIGLGSYVLGGGPDRIKDVIPAEQIAAARKYGRRSGTDPAIVQALVTRYAMDAQPLEEAGDQAGLIALTKNLQSQLGSVMGTPVPYNPAMDPTTIAQLAQYGNESIAPYLGQMNQSDAANMMKVMQMAPFTMYNEQVQQYGLPQPNTLQSLGLGGGAIGGGGLGGGLNLDTLAQVAGSSR